MSHPASQTLPCSCSPIGLCESVSGAGVKAQVCVQESALIYVSEDAALNKKKGSVPFLHFTPAAYDNLSLMPECFQV